MALNNRSVEKAKEILAEVAGWKAPFYNLYNEKNPLDTKTILVYGQTGDGWENVFINIKNITPEQMEIFNKRKDEIHNSSFQDELEEGITRIGWF